MCKWAFRAATLRVAAGGGGGERGNDTRVVPGVHTGLGPGGGGEVNSEEETGG